MATATAADLLVERLLDWGVDVIFGLPGDGINGIIEALRQRRDKIRFVQVRHEESAHFAQALARGTPNREKIALTVLSDKVRELL